MIKSKTSLNQFLAEHQEAVTKDADMFVIMPLNADYGMIEKRYDTRDWEGEDYSGVKREYEQWTKLGKPLLDGEDANLRAVAAEARADLIERRSFGLQEKVLRLTAEVEQLRQSGARMLS